MGLFKTKEEKEFEKKMAIKKTMNAMQKQIAKLEEAEAKFLEIARRAKAQGIPAQLQLAISGLKSTIAQKKRVQEMLLNFEIMNQTKEIASTTVEFLRGMGSLSKDMVKLCDEKQFALVSRQFEMAMAATEAQEERMESFMDSSRDSFANLSNQGDGAKVKDSDIMSIIDGDNASSTTEGGDGNVDDEINALLKSLDGDK